MHPLPLDQTISAVANLNACKLTGSGLQRQSTLPPRYRTKSYEDNFDVDTLWYDTIQVGHRLQLVCPKLNNLASAVRSARWWIDGKPVHLQHIRFRRDYDIIELKASSHKAQKLTIEIDSWSGHSNIAQIQSQIFAGLNTVVMTNKNNKLRWITDFLRFHIHHHRLEAVILMDNDSTLYSIQDLQDAIHQVDLKTILIVSAPFKYGSYFALNGKLFHVETFLQKALLHITRLRYLSKARAVLNCDIDELAYTPNTTIFDLAIESPLGFVSLSTIWRYSNLIDSDPTCHAAHRFKHIVQADKCNVKWCLAPQSLMGWSFLIWNIHWLEFEHHETTAIRRRFFYYLSRTLNYFSQIISLLLCQRAKFWHCRSTTTGWKSVRKLPPPPEQLVPDRECSAALDAVFSPSDSPGFRPPGL